MTTKTQLEKVIDTSERIAAMAEDALRGLDLSISHWPADFRAIIWGAVADIASRRAIDAKNDHC